MAAGPTPLRRLTLQASSVADDLSYVALADLSRVLTDLDASFRIIGGHMVTALAARWQLGPALYRETGDADLGVPPVVAHDATVVDRLAELGYQRRTGNRFTRPVNDVPVRVEAATQPSREAVIDILVPAYTSRPRDNRRFGDHLVTVEVPGLATALRRPPVTLQIGFGRLNGDTLDAELAFPDEVGALVLKALATRVRYKATDVVDVWRCLEVAFAAGVKPSEFAAGQPADAAAIIRSLFAARDGRGMNDLIAFVERQIATRQRNKSQRWHAASIAERLGAERRRHPHLGGGVLARHPTGDGVPEPDPVLPSSRRRATRRPHLAAHPPNRRYTLVLVHAAPPPSRGVATTG